MRLHQEDVLAEMRQNGLHTMANIDAVEHTGGVSIIQKPSRSCSAARTPWS